MPIASTSSKGGRAPARRRLALQFLLEGVRRGERCLYVTLSESERELRVVAPRHGWTLDGIDMFELVPPEATPRSRPGADPAPPGRDGAERDHQERSRPGPGNQSGARRLRLPCPRCGCLSQNPLRYRRQILALKHFFTGRRCTVLLLDDLSSDDDDLQLHSICARGRHPGAAGARLRRRAPPASRRQDAGHEASAAAITTSPSKPAGWRSFRASSPPNTTRRSSANSRSSRAPELDASARRRDRARHQRPVDRRRGCRQVLDRA